MFNNSLGEEFTIKEGETLMAFIQWEGIGNNHKWVEKMTGTTIKLKKPWRTQDGTSFWVYKLLPNPNDPRITKEQDIRWWSQYGSYNNIGTTKIVPYSISGDYSNILEPQPTPAIVGDFTSYATAGKTSDMSTDNSTGSIMDIKIANIPVVFIGAGALAVLLLLKR